MEQHRATYIVHNLIALNQHGMPSPVPLTRMGASFLLSHIRVIGENRQPEIYKIRQPEIYKIR